MEGRAIRGMMSTDPERREQVQLTGNVDGIDTDSSDPNQYLVLAYFGGGRFLKNDAFSLKVRW